MRTMNDNRKTTMHVEARESRGCMRIVAGIFGTIAFIILLTFFVLVAGSCAPKLSTKGYNQKVGR